MEGRYIIMKKKLLFMAIIASGLMEGNVFAMDMLHVPRVQINHIIDSDTSYYSDPDDIMDEPHILIENSSSTYLSDSDICWMTPEQLRYAKNEIYARHGRKFDDAELQKWFDEQDWYNGTIEPEDFNDRVFSAIEKANILLIRHQLEVNSQNVGNSNKSNSNKSNSNKSNSNKPNVTTNKNRSDTTQTNKTKNSNPSSYTMFNCQYPEEFSSERSKVLKKIQELNNQTIDENTINLEVKKNVEYKQTLSQSTYKYFGNIKNGRPDGLGVVLQEATGGIFDDYGLFNCYIPVVAGYFKNGKLSGYGMDIGFYGIDMEGNYENGKLNGNGIVYDNEEIAITNFDALSSIYIEYCQEKSERALSIIDETDFEYSEEVSGLIIVDYPVIQPNVFAEGKFNKGKANGNQKVYHPNYQRNQSTGQYELIKKNSIYGQLYFEGNTKNDSKSGKGTTYYLNGNIQYKGEFKHNKYHGNGTLYNEDGTVKHKGKFKNGDILN